MTNEKNDNSESVLIHLNEIKAKYTKEELDFILGAIELSSEDENFNTELDGNDVILSKTNNHGAIFVQLKFNGQIEFSYAFKTAEGGMVRFDGNFVKGKKASNLKYMEMIFHLDIAKQTFEARKRIKTGIVKFQNNYLSPITKSKNAPGAIDESCLYPKQFRGYVSSPKWHIMEKSKKSRIAK